MSGLIIIGSNNDERYVKMRQALAVSIEVNSPGQRFVVHDFEGCSREEAACLRVGLMKQALKDGESAVAWLDADMLVRGPLDALWLLIGPQTLAALYRPKYEEERFKFNTGVVAVGNSYWTRKLIKQWDEGIKRGNGEWYSDQRELWCAYQKYRHHLELLPLPARLNDNRFGRDSIIWHAKGHSAQRNKAWAREQVRYGN